MSGLTKEEANKVISEKLAEASKLIKECESLANEHSLEFDSPINEWGMGGWYNGKGTDNHIIGWYSSTQSCT